MKKIVKKVLKNVAQVNLPYIVSKAVRKRRQQLPTFLGQQSWELLHPLARIALQSTYRSNTLSTYMFYLLTHVKPPTRSSLANDYVNIATAH